MRHLTAQSALSVPNESSHFIDWHLQEAFVGSPQEWQARCTWVGAASDTCPGRSAFDTRPWLGDVGVWDATEVLARHGVQMPTEHGVNQRIWAARPWRAVLDMVLTHAAKGRVARHVALAQWFDPVDDAAELGRLLDAVQTHLSDLPSEMKTRLEEWLALQADVLEHVPEQAHDTAHH